MEATYTLKNQINAKLISKMLGTAALRMDIEPWNRSLKSLTMGYVSESKKFNFMYKSRFSRTHQKTISEIATVTMATNLPIKIDSKDFGRFSYGESDSCLGCTIDYYFEKNKL